MANPTVRDRHSVTAHALRELIEKLPRYLNGSVTLERRGGRQSGGTSQQLRELQAAWTTAKKSQCFGQSGWSGGIDTRLAKFLGRLELFFEWYQEQVPTRRAQARRVVQSLDPSPIRLPPDIEALRVEEWDKYDGFFQGVAHHDFSCSEDEFAQWVNSLETFLIERLTPRTFEDQDLLDSIIQEGERDA